MWFFFTILILAISMISCGEKRVSESDKLLAADIQTKRLSSESYESLSSLNESVLASEFFDEIKSLGGCSLSSPSCVGNLKEVYSGLILMPNGSAYFVTFRGGDSAVVSVDARIRASSAMEDKAVSTIRESTVVEWNKLVELIEKSNFWTAKRRITYKEMVKYVHGTIFLVEGYKDSKYHFIEGYVEVDETTRENGSEELVDYMRSLARI